MIEGQSPAILIGQLEGENETLRREIARMRGTRPRARKGIVNAPIILTMLASGMCVKRVAGVLKLHPQTVYAVSRNAGYRLSPGYRDRIMAALTKHPATVDELAVKIGLSRRRVGSTLSKMATAGIIEKDPTQEPRGYHGIAAVWRVRETVR